MNKTIWLHRVKYQGHVAYPLLDEKNLLTIGYSDFANPEMVKILEDQNQAAFNQTIEAGWGVCPKGRWSLWYFANMKPGDWVVVPRAYEFRVFEVTDNLEITPDDLKKLDLGWQRKVKPLTNWLPRNFADAPLVSRMKWRGTTIYIDGPARDSVEDAVARAKDNEPLNVYADIVNEASAKWLAHLKKYNTPAKLEKLVEWYLKRVGAVKVGKPLKSENPKGDCDVEGTFENIRTIVCVQVKCYSGKADEYAVNQIAEYADEADTSDKMEDYKRVRWVVSTADGFTEKAVKIAEERNVLLLAGEDLVEFLISSGIDEGINVVG